MNVSVKIVVLQDIYGNVATKVFSDWAETITIGGLEHPDAGMVEFWAEAYHLSSFAKKWNLSYDMKELEVYVEVFLRPSGG